MNEFNQEELKKLYVPLSTSVKGDNGKLMIIAGSVLFHAASLWPLEIASKIVDMVYFSSVTMNNEIVQKDKESFKNGIIVERKDIEKYIEEADSVLIGPGLPRDEGLTNGEVKTKELTEKLLLKFPNKKWVIDGGSLQVISTKIIPQSAIITPNKKEFKMLFNLEPNEDNLRNISGIHDFTILLKGEEDLVVQKEEISIVKGGNAGMTKGGTGDVLAGLTAALYCKNEAFLSAECASFINKKAADSLYKHAGLYYNATDLINEIPKVMKEFIL